MVFAGMVFLCSTRSFRNCIQSKRNDQTQSAAGTSHATIVTRRIADLSSLGFMREQQPTC